MYLFWLHFIFFMVNQCNKRQILCYFVKNGREKASILSSQSGVTEDVAISSYPNNKSGQPSGCPDLL